MARVHLPVIRPRRLVAAALCVLLQALVLAAPLVHAHPDGHDDDHAQGRSVHAHLGGHGHPHERAGDAQGPAFEQEHGRVVYLPLFISTPSTAFDLPAVTPQSFTLGATEAAGHRSVYVAHAHDPPLASSAPPRAPPVFPAFS